MGASVLLAQPRTVDVTVRGQMVVVRELTIGDLAPLAAIFDEMQILLTQKLPGAEIVKSLADRMIGQILAASTGASEEFLRTLTATELLGVLEQVWSLNQLGNLIGRKMTEVLSSPASG